MLFNSYLFVFVFVPATLLGFSLLVRLGSHRGVVAWLVAASLFFYGWWNPAFLLLLGVSIVCNFAFGLLLAKSAERGRKNTLLVTGGVAFNLGLLGYFKYAMFFLENVNSVTGAQWSLGMIVLPLAISFFTFQQITYLVDAYLGKAREYDFLHYCLFVTFFPQLIAGPIVHHRQMLPQYQDRAVLRLKAENLSIGLTIFAIGLFKKTVLADGLAHYATPVFGATLEGFQPTFFEAWVAALGYAFQLYFDFSGYSDMAIGLARMFGILLPLNFNSPYKAESLIDFWQRWHMTLTRFLRDYLYLPLGGKSQGRPRRYFNIFITMVLVGFWHGAGWTYIVFGILQGVLVVMNYVWRELVKLLGWRKVVRHGAFRSFARVLTFTTFVTTLMFFRSETLAGAWAMLKGMAGWNGVALPGRYLEKYPLAATWLEELGWRFSEVPLMFQGSEELIILAGVLALVWSAPNTQEIMGAYNPYLNAPPPRADGGGWFGWFQWRPRPAQALVFGMSALLALVFINRTSEFLYFQF